MQWMQLQHYGRSMNASNSKGLPGRRLFAGIIAAIAALGLGLQPTIGDGVYLENSAALLVYFTIWGNIGACIVMTAIASGRSVPAGPLAALATMLTVVAGVYWTILSDLHHPVGLDRITNQSHHTVIPVLTVIWWLLYSPVARRIPPLMPAIMVPPLSYGAFALVLGLATDFYAYPFLDLNALGWMQFLINNVGLAGFFAVLGAAMVALRNAISRV